MTPVLLLLAATLGADAGWQPSKEGGNEYILQLEPADIDALLDGQEFISDIPAGLPDLRSMRVRYGRGALPQVPSLEKLEKAAEHPTPAAEPTPASAGPELHSATRGRSRSAAADESAAAAPVIRGNDDHDPEDEADEATIRGQSPTSRSNTRSSGRYVDPYDEGRDVRPNTNSSVDDRYAAEPNARSRTTTGANPRLTGSRDPMFDAGPSGTLPKTASSRDLHARRASDEQPWFPFTATLIALFASLGGNWYLGWLCWEYRGRYLRLLSERRWSRPDADVPLSNAA